MMHEADEDFYTLLGVDPKADLQAIRSAYRKQAREHHPDMSEKDDAHEQFNRLAEAYAILSDEKKRRQYDTMRALSFGLPFDKIRRKLSDPAFHRELLKKVSTGLAAAAGLFRSRKPEPGRDLRIHAHISFFESYIGKETELEYGRPVACFECRGTGFSQIEPCLVCNGEGRLQSEGFPGIRKRCPRCDGRGWRGVEGCDTCSSTGRVTRNKTVRIVIPPGVNDRQRLRLRGLGEGARGSCGEGKPGDLIVVVNVAGHPTLRREGSDLRAMIHVPFKTAVLGGDVEMELPQGRVGIQVPMLTWDGRMLRLIGSGFPDAKSGLRGDAFFTVSILPPVAEPEKEIFLRYCGHIRGPEDRPDDLLNADLERVFASC